MKSVEPKQKSPMQWVYAAWRLGYLKSEEAIHCFLVYGRKLEEGQPFHVDNFLLEEGLVQQQDLSHVLNLLKSWDEQIDDTHVLFDIQRTLEDTWSTSYEMLEERTLSSFDSENELSLPRFQRQSGISRADSVSLSKNYQSENSEERYKAGQLLGQGGLGVVVECVDTMLGRKVAKKTLKQNKIKPQMMLDFVQEARITGFLEHPNIIPIYDMGEDAEGIPYYTMRLLPSQTLLDVMASESTTLTQFLKIMQQICMGIEYAHSQGVVHRDIKPANILIGQFGEVLIADWGVAKVLSSAQGVPTHETSENTRANRLKGTPAFMAPEQIEAGHVTPFVDQYALGVILYQYLTGFLPFYSENIYTLLFQICSHVPEPPRQLSPERNIPQDLEQICLKMMEKNPKNRFSSCREVYDRLEEYLEGTKDRQRRRMMASERVESASKSAETYHGLVLSAKALQSEWEQASSSLSTWASVEEKRKVWEMEESFQNTQREAEHSFGGAVQRFTQALEHEPGNKQARAGLADLYWSRFCQAEREQDELGQIYYSELIRLYDDGRYLSMLDGGGNLELEVYPSGAHVDVSLMVEEDRRLVPELMFEKLETPLSISLPMGSYQLDVHCDGYRSAKLPVMVERCGEVKLSLQLYSEAEIGADMVFVPAGQSVIGDPLAPMGVREQTVTIDDFFITRYPVTLGEYLEFINDTHTRDADLAASMLPRNGEEIYVVWDELNGEYQPDRESLFHGPIAEMYPAHQQHEYNLPVFGVNWFDAVRYCRWRSAKEGREFTLPTEEQWEKAARGVDRRIFPWGNRFEPTYCKMGRSRVENLMQPEPVGTFPEDCSPYGMKDVVGAVAEWTLGLPDEQVKALEAVPKEVLFYRAGGWVAANDYNMRIGTRVPKLASTTSYNVGFRIVANQPKK